MLAGLLIGATAYASVPLVADGGAANDQSKTSQAPAAMSSKSCQPTTTRDASGVITVDGNIGIIGETFTRTADESFMVVRRGAVAGDNMSLQFTQIGTSAPASWVKYDSPATEQPSKTPWGDRAAFPAGWKPIGFGNSCWRLIVDGRDTGIVLAVGPV